ncbi:MAG: hypothetical protein K2W82_00660 [Candidatus Obscuribacterales bacterium]|nr:hypothetical protein [Candidatus Obscuribacterales bacterium]
MQKIKLAGRRQAFFGASVLLAGISMINLCLVPLFVDNAIPEPLFHTVQQQNFFFDLFGFISACWLLCWLSAINQWYSLAKLGQWAGLLFLCIGQVNLLGVWKILADKAPLLSSGLWIAPGLLEIYILGCFFGFFTLPGLVKDGNRSLTSLGTLLLLLPWLIARNAVILGSQQLNGLFG